FKTCLRQAVETELCPVPGAPPDRKFNPAAAPGGRSPKVALGWSTEPANRALQQTKPGRGSRSTGRCGAGGQLRCPPPRHSGTIVRQLGAPASLLNAMSLDGREMLRPC